VGAGAVAAAVGWATRRALDHASCKQKGRDREKEAGEVYGVQ
jgi:hypothetical protein